LVKIKQKSKRVSIVYGSFCDELIELKICMEYTIRLKENLYTLELASSSFCILRVFGNEE